jgi:hypothetical protein
MGIETLPGIDPRTLAGTTHAYCQDLNAILKDG